MSVRFTLCLFAVLAGCTNDTDLETNVRTDAAQGRVLFAANCAVCHSADARGGEPASLGLGVVAPDLTRLTMMNNGIFPRNQVMSAIDGFNRQNHWENAMPVFGDESLGAVIQVEENGVSTPIPADLLALANYLESIQK